MSVIAGVCSGVGSKAQGLFALGEDTQRILGVIAVVVAALKVSQRQKWGRLGGFARKLDRRREWSANAQRELRRQAQTGVLFADPRQSLRYIHWWLWMECVMDDLVREVIPLLQYLIPGFLAAWIFYSLTPFKRPDSFGQIVQALIFTFVIHGLVAAFGWVLTGFGDRVFSVGHWGAVAQSLCSFVVAVLLGLWSCYIANNDNLHRLLRKRKITAQTSYSSEWFSTFTSYPRYVVLHLSDERRLYGWPSEWPAGPTAGQFVLQEPSWLDDKGTETPLKAEVLVIDATKVQWVEFSPPQPRTCK